jgi:hypothetical protein
MQHTLLSPLMKAQTVFYILLLFQLQFSKAYSGIVGRQIFFVFASNTNSDYICSRWELNSDKKLQKAWMIYCVGQKLP